MFVWDAKTSIRTLDKMNNSRPIIKTFLFPYTERTNVFFLQFCQLFYFCPHTKTLDTPKWFSDCESVTSVVSKINQEIITWEQKWKKTFKRTEKINKIGGQHTLFMFILSDQIILLFPADTFSRKQLIFRPHYKRNKHKLLEKRSCMSV